MSEIWGWICFMICITVILVAMIAGISHNSYYWNEELAKIQIKCIENGGTWFRSEISYSGQCIAPRGNK